MSLCGYTETTLTPFQFIVFNYHNRAFLLYSINKYLILLLVILSLLFSQFALSAQDNTTDLYNKDYQLLREFYSPRDEGSQNEKKLITYIENFCQNEKISYKTSLINNSKDIVTHSYNLEVYLKGSSKDQDQLIIICPLNTPIINQENYDNSLSLKIVLDLIKKCRQSPFKKDLIFLFSGANENESKQYNGIRFFLENTKNLNRSIITVIDLISSNSLIYFTGSMNGRPIPLVLLKNFFSLEHLERNIRFNKSQIYRSRFYIQPEEHYISYLLKENLTAVSFSNRSNTLSNTFIFDPLYQENLTRNFNEWLTRLDNITLPIDADYHYQYSKLFSYNFIIPEHIQIILYLILIYFSIFTRIFFPKFQRTHVSLLFKILPYFMLIFMIYFICSFIPILIFLPLSLKSGVPNLHLSLPILYYINIFIIPLLIIFVLFEFIKKLPFPKHTFLYIYGAYIFALINFIIVLLIDVSIAFIYLWVIVILTVSQFTGNNFFLKYILYIISPVPLILLTVNLSLADSFRMLSTINPILQNLLFCIFTFPFILLSLRVNIINTNIFRILLSKRISLFFIFLLLLLSFFIINLITINNFPPEKFIKAILVNNLPEKKQYLTITSEQTIGKIIIKDSRGETDSYIPTSQKTITVRSFPIPYTTQLTRGQGQGSLPYQLKIDSQILIEYLRIYLITPTDLYPLDSSHLFNKVENFPGKYNPESEDVYKFLVERNVLNPFYFNVLLIPANYRLYIEIEYPQIDENIINIQSIEGIINKRTLYFEQFNLDNTNDVLSF